MLPYLSSIIHFSISKPDLILVFSDLSLIVSLVLSIDYNWHTVIELKFFTSTSYLVLLKFEVVSYFVSVE